MLHLALLTTAQTGFIYRPSKHVSLANAQLMVNQVFRSEPSICPVPEEAGLSWVYDPNKRVAFVSNNNITPQCALKLENETGIRKMPLAQPINESCYTACGHPTCPCPRQGACVPPAGENGQSPCAPGM